MEFDRNQRWANRGMRSHNCGDLTAAAVLTPDLIHVDSKHGVL